jgi:hypothetical protein
MLNVTTENTKYLHSRAIYSNVLRQIVCQTLDSLPQNSV